MRWVLIGVGFAIACNGAPATPSPTTSPNPSTSTNTNTNPNPSPSPTTPTTTSTIATTIVQHDVTKAVEVEVKRLLETAAGHASFSAACVDGPGHRVNVSNVALDPVSATMGQPFQVRAKYRFVTTYDPQECAPEPCQQAPTSEKHSVTLRFESMEGGWLVKGPKRVPGPHMTALDRFHSGGCGIKSPAFRPKPVTPAMLQ